MTAIRYAPAHKLSIRMLQIVEIQEIHEQILKRKSLHSLFVAQKKAKINSLVLTKYTQKVASHQSQILERQK